MIEMGKTYTTREGRPVRILCVDAEGDYPVVGMIGPNCLRWKINGNYNYMGHNSLDDLIPAKTKREGWINIYTPSNDFSLAFVSDVYKSREDADASAASMRVACIHIQWEE